MSWATIHRGLQKDRRESRERSFSDELNIDKLTDPRAYEDVKAAHAWVTKELEDCERLTVRHDVLTNERRRLAGIAWRLQGK